MPKGPAPAGWLLRPMIPLGKGAGEWGGWFGVGARPPPKRAGGAAVAASAAS